MSKTKQDFLTVSTRQALHLTDKKTGKPCAAAYALQMLFPDRYPTPAILREVWALVKEYTAQGIRVPQAFVFNPQ